MDKLSENQELSMMFVVDCIFGMLNV